MKFKHKEDWKRSTALAKDHHPLRVFMTLVVFLGILLSTSLFYYHEVSWNSVKESFPLAGSMFNLVGNLVTGAAIGVEEIKIQSTCAVDYASGGTINTSVVCENEVITANGDIIIVDISEEGTTSFTDDDEAVYDLRGNSSAITAEIPDLNPDTPAEYTNNWDTTPYDFRIAMNESENIIQLYINLSNQSYREYGIDLDNSESNGYWGYDIVFGYDNETEFDAYIDCYNSTEADTQTIALGDGQGEATCGNYLDENFVGNFTIYYNISNYIIEAVIDLNQSWEDKKTIVEADGEYLYTTFKNSTVITDVGNLTLNNVTLNLEGHLNFSGGYLNISSSNITFLLTGNGSSNFTADDGTILNLNGNTFSSNDTSLYYGWRVRSGEEGTFSITNNNFSNSGGGSDDYRYGNIYTNVYSGTISRNTFSNCNGALYGSCVYLYADSHHILLSSNIFNGDLASNGGNNITVYNNTFNDGLLNYLGRNFNVTENTINNGGTGVYSGQTDFNATFTNNIFNCTIFDWNNTVTGTMIFSNQYGKINWSNKGNLTTGTSFSIGNKVYLEDNNIGIADNPGLSNYNSSATITFYNLTGWGSNNPVILKNNVTCSSPNCNVTSWNNTLGTLVVNVASFSNYSAQDGGGPSLTDNYPNVTLISPAASYVNDSANRTNITFSCNASDDNQLVNISLYLTNSTNQSFSRNQTTSVGGTSNSSNWTVELGVGNYTWNCLAFDNASQSNFSTSNRSIKLNYTALTIITINLSVGNNNSFQLLGQETHTLTLNNCTNTTANITFESTPQNFILTQDQAQNIDTDDNDYYDHQITLTSANAGVSATFTVQTINTYYGSSSGSSGGGRGGREKVISSTIEEDVVMPSESDIVKRKKPITPSQPSTEPSPSQKTIIAPEAPTIEAPSEPVSSRSYSIYIIAAIVSVLLFSGTIGIIRTYNKRKARPFYPSPHPTALPSLPPATTVGQITQKITKLQQPSLRRVKVIQEVTQRVPVAKEMPTPAKLRPAILETTSTKMKLDLELMDIQLRLNKLEKENVSAVKVIQDLPRTPGQTQLSSAQKTAQREEFEGLSKALLFSLKRPYLLLRKMFPRPKSERELQVEELARRQVIEISKKIEGDKPRPPNELEQLEEEIRKLRSK